MRCRLVLSGDYLNEDEATIVLVSKGDDKLHLAIGNAMCMVATATIDSVEPQANQNVDSVLGGCSKFDGIAKRWSLIYLNINPSRLEEAL